MPSFCTSHTSPVHSNGIFHALRQSTCWLNLSRYDDTQSLGACKLPAPAAPCEPVASRCGMEQQMAVCRLHLCLLHGRGRLLQGGHMHFCVRPPMAAPTIYNSCTGFDDETC